MGSNKGVHSPMETFCTKYVCIYLCQCNTFDEMNMEVTNWKELNSLLESLVKSFRNAPESADVMGSIHSGDENFKSLIQVH